MTLVYSLILAAFIVEVIEALVLWILHKENKRNETKHWKKGFDDGYIIGVKIGASGILENNETKVNDND